MNAVDALAITMVAVLAFALGCVATLFLIMARNANRQPKLPDFPKIDENGNLVDENKAPATDSDDSSPQAWEKDPDWWKKN